MLSETSGSPGTGVTLNNWQTPEQLAWSFQHIAYILPTAAISRAAAPAAPFESAPAPVENLPLVTVDGRFLTVGEVMDWTYTDGWLVEHDGKILAEHYPVVRFSKEYTDPDAEVRQLEEAIGWKPWTHPGPRSMYEFLLGLKKVREHGGTFEYRSAETDVLGWVCEAAGGARMQQLMSRLLWSRIGAEEDANIGVDSTGTGMFDGGMYRNQFWIPREGSDVILALGIHGQMIYINRPARVVTTKLSSWPVPQDAWMLLTTLTAFGTIAAAVQENRI